MNILPVLRRPKVLGFDVTYDCNLQCKMCNAWKLGNGKKELTADQIVSTFFDYQRHYGIEHVRFLGGEPLLREDLPEIIRSVSSSATTDVVTNGVLMTPGLAQKLVQSGLHNLRVSIDGPADVHDSIRGEGTFEKASQALDIVREAKKQLGVEHPEVTVWQCTSRINRGSLKEMYLFAKSKGAGFSMHFMHDGLELGTDEEPWEAPRVVRRLVDPLDICLTLEERRRVTLEYFDMLAAVEDRGAISSAKIRLGARARLWYSKFGSVVYRDCSRSMHAIIVDPWGDLFVCEHLYAYPYGNCLTDGVRAWGSEKHLQLREAIRSGSLSTCRDCNRFCQYRSRSDCFTAPSRLVGF